MMVPPRHTNVQKAFDILSTRLSHTGPTHMSNLKCVLRFAKPEGTPIGRAGVSVERVVSKLPLAWTQSCRTNTSSTQAVALPQITTCCCTLPLKKTATGWLLRSALATSHTAAIRRRACVGPSPRTRSRGRATTSRRGRSHQLLLVYADVSEQGPARA